MRDLPPRPDDLLELFEIDSRKTAVPETARPDPVLRASPSAVEPRETGRLDPARAVAEPDKPPPVPHRPALRFGLIGSLGVHLLPLLVLVHWNTAPAEIAPPIAVQLVVEEPPPLPPPAEKPPPPGRLASIDIGEPAAQPEQPAQAAAPAAAPAEEVQVASVVAPPKPSPPSVFAPPDLVPPDLASTLPKPAPAAEPALTPPEPIPLPLQRKPTPKLTVAARIAPNPHPAPRSTGVPGPAATRDEYLAYCETLIRRYREIVPASLIGGRRGMTSLRILVYGDGTIGRIAVAQSSGYPDIDASVERMVAAVVRFPPLPQWIQAPNMMLQYDFPFPAGLRQN